MHARRGTERERRGERESERQRAKERGTQQWSATEHICESRASSSSPLFSTPLSDAGVHTKGSLHMYASSRALVLEWALVNRHRTTNRWAVAAAECPSHVTRDTSQTAEHRCAACSAGRHPMLPLANPDSLCAHTAPPQTHTNGQ